MILTDELITEANSEGWVRIEPFEPDQIQPASYDLRIGPEAVTSSSGEKINVREKGFIELAPSDFAIVVSEEKISLDKQTHGSLRSAEQVGAQGNCGNYRGSDRPGLSRTVDRGTYKSDQ